MFRRFSIASSALALGSLMILGAEPAGALSYGSTAWAQVSGNCRTQLTSKNTGGNFIGASQADATSTGPINGSCAASYLPGPWLGTSYAFASLSTGQLKVLASGQGSEAVGNLYPNASLVNLDVLAQATYFDTFRLIPPAGYSGANPIIDIILTVTYNVALGSGSNQSNYAALNWYLLTSSATVNNLRTDRCIDSGIISNPTTCFSYGYPGGALIRHRIAVPVATPQVSISALMFARTFNNGTADASATGTLSLVLPAGFSIESDSVVLLTPEPELALLLPAGLLALASVRRRASRSL